MSEGGEVEQPQAEQPAPGPSATPAEAMDVNTALTKVLKVANANNGLARGLHECVRALEAGKALLCVLAESLDQPDYERLIKALCAEKNVSQVSVSEKTQLGEWAGLCKYDSDGNARKVVGCSCCVITDYGDDTEALAVLQNYLKKQTA